MTSIVKAPMSQSEIFPASELDQIPTQDQEISHLTQDLVQSYLPNDLSQEEIANAVGSINTHFSFFLKYKKFPKYSIFITAKIIQFLATHKFFQPSGILSDTLWSVSDSKPTKYEFTYSSKNMSDKKTGEIFIEYANNRDIKITSRIQVVDSK